VSCQAAGGGHYSAHKLNKAVCDEKDELYRVHVDEADRPPSLDRISTLLDK